MDYGIWLIIAVLILIFILRPRSRNKRNGHGYPSRGSSSQAEVVEPIMVLGVERGVDPFPKQRPLKTIVSLEPSLDEFLKGIEVAGLAELPKPTVLTSDDPWEGVESDEVLRT